MLMLVFLRCSAIGERKANLRTQWFGTQFLFLSIGVTKPQFMLKMFNIFQFRYLCRTKHSKSQNWRLDLKLDLEGWESMIETSIFSFDNCMSKSRELRWTCFPLFLVLTTSRFKLWLKIPSIFKGIQGKIVKSSKDSITIYRCWIDLKATGIEIWPMVRDEIVVTGRVPSSPPSGPIFTYVYTVEYIGLRIDIQFSSINFENFYQVLPILQSLLAFCWQREKSNRIWSQSPKRCRAAIFAALHIIFK